MQLDTVALKFELEKLYQKKHNKKVNLLNDKKNDLQ